MNSPDALMLVDTKEMVEDDWLEFKEHMIKLNLKWKWINPDDWNEK